MRCTQTGDLMTAEIFLGIRAYGAYLGFNEAAI